MGRYILHDECRPLELCPEVAVRTDPGEVGRGAGMKGEIRKGSGWVTRVGVPGLTPDGWSSGERL